MELTVYEVLTFHRPDRAAFDHLLSLRAGRESARDAVALLIWLYRCAYTREDAASRVPATIVNPFLAARLVSECHAALGGASVSGNVAPPALIPSLCGAFADRVRGVLTVTPAAELRRGVDEVLAGVGALLFNDQLHEIMRGYVAGGGRGPLPDALAVAYDFYRPSGESMEQYDTRSLFIVFAPGEPQPFTNREIFECSNAYVALSSSKLSLFFLFCFHSRVPSNYIVRKESVFQGF